MRCAYKNDIWFTVFDLISERKMACDELEKVVAEKGLLYAEGVIQIYR